MLQVKNPTIRNPRTVLDRKETCQYIFCSASKLRELEMSELFPRNAYFGYGRRRYYFADKLDEWLAAGGELGARMRLEQEGKGVK